MTSLFTNPFILDGATGTQLQKRGMPPGVCTESWTLEHPEAIVELQRAYAAAGSQAVFAPTFGANRASLKAHGAESRVREYCLRLVELSRVAVNGAALVGGDMAPCGLRPEPFGDSSSEEITEVFAEQARALEEAGVDFFGVETQMSADEALCAVTAVRSVSKKPVAVSFTCGPTGRTLWGETLSDALKLLEPLGIDAFGLNCVGDLELLTSLIAELHAQTELPLIAKPNAGLPEYVEGRAVYRMTPAQLASRVPELLRAGASLLGGCCGTGPEHIAAIKAAL